MKYQTTFTLTEGQQLFCRYALCALVCVAMYGLMSFDANATAGQRICQRLGIEMGTLGPAIGTIGVLIVGISAALGRISGTMAVTVAVGIAAISNAAGIAGGLGAGC